MNALVIDDMIDTAGTIEKVVDEIKNKGAKEVSIVTSHAILSDPATEILTKLYNKGVLKEVITTDTVKHSDKYLKENSSWLKILSVAPLVAGMIYRINHGDETTKAYPR